MFVLLGEIQQVAEEYMDVKSIAKGMVAGKGALHLIEAIVGGIFSIGVFVSFFWFDDWWQRALSAVIFMVLVIATVGVCSYARGER
ncbi:hypothetical protein [Serratia rubidaea]|nr:hypothetical protein [Serratia rubidaea]MBS0973663.1 hypothetical protein [Serratia rubidaea]MCR0998438.1 hypothetical protein [Serratia rubidaea]QPR62491.1 hypothetical protein I6G83_16935 [Serratia rubidaea]HAY0635889.1 hypothetical protein [Serratia rubidaea]